MSGRSSKKRGEFNIARGVNKEARGAKDDLDQITGQDLYVDKNMSLGFEEEPASSSYRPPSYDAPKKPKQRSEAERAAILKAAESHNPRLVHKSKQDSTKTEEHSSGQASADQSSSDKDERTDKASKQEIKKKDLSDINPEEKHEIAPIEPLPDDKTEITEAETLNEYVEDAFVSAKPIFDTDKYASYTKSYHNRSKEAASDDSKNAKVFYLNGERLNRPLSMPKHNITISLIFIALAVIIGAIFLYFYFDATVNEPIREREVIKENISRNVDLDLPSLATLIPLDNASIIATLEASGDTIFDKSAETGSSVLDLIKLPSDVSLVDASVLYLKGTSKLSGSQASKLLNGSWELEVDRTKGLNMSIHYVDFKSGSVDSAIQSALVAEGLDQTELAESGTDDAGNTYATGNMEVDGQLYAWRISALPFSDLYSINGIPDDTVYVGIRVTN